AVETRAAREAPTLEVGIRRVRRHRRDRPAFRRTARLTTRAAAYLGRGSSAPYGWTKVRWMRLAPLSSLQRTPVFRAHAKERPCRIHAVHCLPRCPSCGRGA